MSDGGAAFLEVGAGQAAAVAALLRRHALDVVDIKGDLAGIPRCVVARRRDLRGDEKKVGNEPFPD
jgi:methylase of polypeptide subunit release factors